MEKVLRIHPFGIVDKGHSESTIIRESPSRAYRNHTLSPMCPNNGRSFLVFRRIKKEKKFAKLANNIQSIILENSGDQPFPFLLTKQSLFSTLLYFNLLPEDERKICHRLVV